MWKNVKWFFITKLGKCELCDQMTDKQTIQLSVDTNLMLKIVNIKTILANL